MASPRVHGLLEQGGQPLNRQVSGTDPEGQTLAPWFYYGQDLPDETWARSFRGSVVLQSYHQLVQHGFAEAFPLARRYVHVSLTALDPWVLVGRTEHPALRSFDSSWGVYRLDLDEVSAQEWLRQRCVDLATADEGRLHGFFLDDVDDGFAFSPEVARALLSSIHEQTGLSWFLNRGFSALDDVAGVAEILLEDVHPDHLGDLNPDAIRWNWEIVLPALSRARGRGVDLHALVYQQLLAPTPEDGESRALAAALRSVVATAQIAADPHLRQWPALAPEHDQPSETVDGVPA